VLGASSKDRRDWGSQNKAIKQRRRDKRFGVGFDAGGKGEKMARGKDRE